MAVCIGLKAAYAFVLSRFVFLFIYFIAATFNFFIVNSALVHCSQVPQITLFNNFFSKNWSHSTIYTFKNYFATMFSVSFFSFSKNKLYPNRPLINLYFAPLAILFIFLKAIKNFIDKLKNISLRANLSPNNIQTNPRKEKKKKEKSLSRF